MVVATISQILANNKPEALNIAPDERLTIDRLKLFVAHISETNAPNSVASITEGLYTAARVMMPNRDWSWLKAIKSRLAAVVPRRSPVGPVITSVQLLELGLKLMDENKPEANSKLAVRRAVAYRDGLMISVLAYSPLRPKNGASLEIGRHVIQERDRWFIVVPPEETKTGKRIQFEIPPLLVSYLTAYLALVRPRIIRGRTHTALWVSPKGGALSYVAMCKSFVRLSTRLGCGYRPTMCAMLPSRLGLSLGLIRSPYLGTCCITADSTRPTFTIGPPAYRPAARTGRSFRIYGRNPESTHACGRTLN